MSATTVNWPMPVEWFKLQTPLASSWRGPSVYIYNEAETMHVEVVDDKAQQLIDGLGMKQHADKIYVRGVFKDNQLHVDRDTVTREEKTW